MFIAEAKLLCPVATAAELDATSFEEGGMLEVDIVEEKPIVFVVLEKRADVEENVDDDGVEKIEGA